MAENLKKGRVGSSVDDFLAQEGILEECQEQAIKQILADQIQAAMEKEGLTKTAMAARMETSRRALDRLLDPGNTSVTLHTLPACRLRSLPGEQEVADEDQEDQRQQSYK